MSHNILKLQDYSIEVQEKAIEGIILGLDFILNKYPELHELIIEKNFPINFVTNQSSCFVRGYKWAYDGFKMTILRPHEKVAFGYKSAIAIAIQLIDAIEGYTWNTYNLKSVAGVARSIPVDLVFHVATGVVHEFTHLFQWYTGINKGEVLTTKNELEFAKEFYPEYYSQIGSYIRPVTHKSLVKDMMKQFPQFEFKRQGSKRELGSNNYWFGFKEGFDKTAAKAAFCRVFSTTNYSYNYYKGPKELCKFVSVRRLELLINIYEEELSKLESERQVEFAV